MSGQLAIEQYCRYFRSLLRHAAFTVLRVHTYLQSIHCFIHLPVHISYTASGSERVNFRSYENMRQFLGVWTPSKLLATYLEKLKSNDLQYDSCFSMNCVKKIISSASKDAKNYTSVLKTSMLTFGRKCPGALAMRMVCSRQDTA